MRKLAKEIGRSRHLNVETLEELYGHLEDKTLGYLSGEEDVSEADAVLLTREHFGDPGAFPELGVKTVPFRSPISLPRRLGAVALLTLTVGVAFEAIKVLIAFFLDTQSAIGLFDPRMIPVIWLGPALNAGAIFLVLRWWYARERCGVHVWYQDRKPSPFALIFLALVALRWCIPDVRVVGDVLSKAADSLVYFLLGLPRPVHWLFIALGPALAVAVSMLWIWWADRGTLRIRSILAAVMALVALGVGKDIPSVLFGNPTYLFGETTARFEIQTTATNVAAFQEAYGIAPDNMLVTALALLGYSTAMIVTVAGAAAVTYILAGSAFRMLRRCGGIEIRLRPASR